MAMRRSTATETCLSAVLASFFLVLLPYGIPFTSATCVPPPVPVRIGNVTLPNQMIARGVEMSIGQPAQNVALLPLWSVT